MMHGKAVWKPGIGEIAKAFGIASGPHKGDFISCKGQCADVRWVMAYGHKTQSFMKNGGQQKCLDTALIEIENSS